MKIRIYTLLLLLTVITIKVNAQAIRLYLNGDTVPTKKIDCWSFSRLDVVFDYDKKITSGTMVGVILSVQNKYNTINFLGQLDLKEVKKEGAKNKKVGVAVFKSTDPREETGYFALMSGTHLTRGTMYYEIGEKGEDTTWLSISVVKQDKSKKVVETDEDETDNKSQGESIGLYDVVIGPEKIMMLNRSWIDGREWDFGPDLPFPAGNCKGITIEKFPDGEWSRKNVKGDIVSKGNYLNGLRQGVWVQYSEEDGKFLREIRHYNKGVLSGSCTRFKNDGIVSETGSYLNGKRHGTWFTYENYGEQDYIFDYDNGVPTSNPYRLDDNVRKFGKMIKDLTKEGPWVEYSLATYDSCFYKNGMREGVGVKYFEGILRKKDSELNNQNDGPEFKYSDDGILESEIWYKAGEKNGIYRHYEDGCLRDEGTYLKGKRDGLWKKYTCSDYYLQEEETWKNDEREGPFKEYFKNGKLKREGNYLLGEYNGPYKEYFDNGKVSEEGNYKKGKRTGSWKIYSSSGELYETKTY